MLKNGTQALVKSDTWECEIDNYRITGGEWALCTYIDGKFYVNKTCYYDVWTYDPLEYRLFKEEENV